jgi:hypothetical protein
MAPAFQEAGAAPAFAGDAELCRRLYADVLGVYPTQSEIEADCVGRSADEIVDELQTRDRYLLVSERHWQSRLRTSDVITDWRYLQGLYELVRLLHTGDLDYESFGVQVLAHPGFNLSVFQPEERARLAFSVFLGRVASDAEAVDIGSLFRAWIPAFGEDPDVAYLPRTRAQIFPFLCDPVSSCTAELLGGASLEFPATGGFQILEYEDLDEDFLAALNTPGELITRQPFYWEAAADEILDRYLDWHDGGRVPRTPGHQHPAVREALAQFLRETGDYPAAEKLVLTSWMYRQTNQVPSVEGVDQPVVLTGPLKAASAEVWFDSALNAVPPVFPRAAADPRYGDGFPYFLIYQAINDGTVTVEQASADFQLLHDLRDDRLPLHSPNGYLEPDYRYLFLVRGIGGAPGFDAERQRPEGLSYAFQQEALAELVCQPEVGTGATPTGELDVEGVLNHQMRLFFGRAPTPDEVTDLEAAAEACEDEDCTPAGRVRSLCVALLGASEMLFY